MEFLQKLQKFLSGKKTYAVAIIGAVLVGLQWAGITVPEGVWMLLSLLGLGAIRSAIGKIEPPK